MKKIMLIDDNSIANFIVKTTLDRIAGDFEVHEYTSASTALNDLDKVHPDVVFLDLAMPVMDGWDFLEVMKENKLDFRVYLLTSSTSPLDIQKAKNYQNVREFLIKPVGAKILESLLNSEPE